MALPAIAIVFVAHNVVKIDALCGDGRLAWVALLEIGRGSLIAGSCHDILAAMSPSVERPQVGVGVVFLRDGRVFLARRQGSHGEATWASAGGNLELGESLEECARREALEELGLVVGQLRFLCVANIIAYGRHYLDVEFLGEIGDQEPLLAEPEAFTEFGWFPLDNLPQPIFEPMRYALDSLRTGQHYYPGGIGAAG